MTADQWTALLCVAAIAICLWTLAYGRETRRRVEEYRWRSQGHRVPEPERNVSEPPPNPGHVEN